MADSAAPRLILARHGETEMNRLLRCQGWLDAPLNDRGWEQARLLADHLAADPVTQVYTSPLKRAHMTASIVAAQHGLPVEARPEFREIHHGRLEGVPFAELDVHVPGLLEAWRTRPHEVVMPEGESLADLQARAWPEFEAVSAAYLGSASRGMHQGSLVLVSHAITMGTILCRLLDEPLAVVRRFRVVPCGHWELTHDGEKWRVVKGEGVLDDD